MAITTFLGALLKNIFKGAAIQAAAAEPAFQEFYAADK
jgi:hypothetical protein